MVALKTQPTGAPVAAYLAAITPEPRRQDAETLCQMMARVTGWEAKMWGASIVGFGRYYYRYRSGREGNYFVVGFAVRKGALVVYIMPGYRDFGGYLSRLGKYKRGQACLYLKKLSDIDLTVLESMLVDAVAYMKENYRVERE